MGTFEDVMTWAAKLDDSRTHDGERRVTQFSTARMGNEYYIRVRITHTTEGKEPEPHKYSVGAQLPLQLYLYPDNAVSEKVLRSLDEGHEMLDRRMIGQNIIQDEDVPT